MLSQVRLFQAAAAEARAVRRAALPDARLLRRRLRRGGGVDARRPGEDAADDARRRVRRQHGELPPQDRTGRRSRRAVPRLPRDVDADRAVGLPLLRLLRAVPQRAQRRPGAARKAEGQVESGEWAARARHATPALARVCCHRGDFYTPILESYLYYRRYARAIRASPARHPRAGSRGRRASRRGQSRRCRCSASRKCARSRCRRRRRRLRR